MGKKIIIVSIIAIVFVALFLLFLYGYYKKEDGDFKIYFFRAGKADCSIITLNDKTIMIDTGEYSLYPSIKQYLNNHHIQKIDLLILTHNDKDHIGSASSLIDEFEIDSIYQSNIPKDSEYYSNYLSSLEKKNINPITVMEDISISLDDLIIHMNGPIKEYEKNKSNNSSIITRIVYFNTSYLFMGDVQNDRIRDYLDNHNENVDVLKLPYHGNYQKMDEELLSILKPQYIIVSTSSNVLDQKLSSLLEKEKYYVTKDGNITLTSNGENIHIRQ